MTKARKDQVCLDATPYYHCVSRCVRRAFLCGKQYNHRRQWVEDKLIALAQIFCIDIAAYAVMSNHYHVVLFVDRQHALSASDEEIVERWHRIYKGTLLSQRFIKGEPLAQAERQKLSELILLWRYRLMDISWFMRVMNEFIAREANKEDKCTGRFWEGRFKSQALLDEKALLACMAYVDLNPLRAKMVSKPEHANHTSLKKRCNKAKKASSPNHKYQQPNELLVMLASYSQGTQKGIPCSLTDYLALVDWSGRCIQGDKRGYIPCDIPDVLERIGITPQNFSALIKTFEVTCKSFAGTESKLLHAKQVFGYKRIANFNIVKAAFA